MKYTLPECALANYLRKCCQKPNFYLMNNMIDSVRFNFFQRHYSCFLILMIIFILRIFPIQLHLFLWSTVKIGNCSSRSLTCSVRLSLLRINYYVIRSLPLRFLRLFLVLGAG